MRYRRITLELRYQIEALHQARHSRQAIADQLGFDRSSIGRELRRVRPYTAEAAQQHALAVQARRHRPRIEPGIWTQVEAALRQCHSPEQIYGRSQVVGWACPSIERIYQHVYARPSLAQYLRRGRRQRRPHSVRHTAAPLWTCITARPAAANTRQEIGHLEADLLHGRQGTGSLVVMQDRCSRRLSLNLVARKTAANVFAAMDSVLDENEVRSITIDQGREFVWTPLLSQQWAAGTYACHAGSPWEKGMVENSNGLLRQFFPKGTDFRQIELEAVLVVEHLLNHRPRKGLGFRTPAEVHSHHQSRALAT